jgi:hypothetical protein
VFYGLNINDKAQISSYTEKEKMNLQLQ